MINKLLLSTSVEDQFRTPFTQVKSPILVVVEGNDGNNDGNNDGSNDGSNDINGGGNDGTDNAEIKPGRNGATLNYDICNIAHHFTSIGYYFIHLNAC